jgi:uncharacterized membrane protein YkvA (DUF1232 family)
MDLSDLFRAVVIVLGVLVLVGAAVIGFVMWRFRVPPRGVVAMVVALFYLATPVDVVPEAVLGPLGLVDDAGVVTGVAVLVYRLVRARAALQKGGVIGRDRREGP